LQAAVSHELKKPSSNEAVRQLTILASDRFAPDHAFGRCGQFSARRARATDDARGRVPQKLNRAIALVQIPMSRRSVPVRKRWASSKARTRRLNTALPRTVLWSAGEGARWFSREGYPTSTSSQPKRRRRDRGALVDECQCDQRKPNEDAVPVPSGLSGRLREAKR
jgi:hypothetical protein